ncbi:hypothetical protein NDU88_004074 [Pleurodeles waltl]|uniref:Uncharacterized protein n=1 Tax=Pleurodeles waltl TaxID=8319 RepID=A0AAV7VG18_PLEWA|nr:hypothetical protein NDU88_004074 [Pleurodeles waltl]
MGVDLLYPWGTTKDIGEALCLRLPYGSKRLEEDAGKAERDREEREQARRRMHVGQAQRETCCVIIGDEKQDKEAKEEIKVDGHQTMRRENPQREDREGERHTRKQATFQEERGSARYVNRAGEGNVMSSGEGIDDRETEKNYIGTN